jgi:hypothetical protein
MKIITSLLLMLFISQSAIFTQDNNARRISQAKEDGQSYYENTAPNPIPFLSNSINPIGTIPNLVTFADYVTNGNYLRKLFVLGDTVVMAADHLDSTFTNLNERRIRYNVSFNGGNTWESTVLIINPANNQAYGEISPLVVNSLRTVGASGRQYAGGSRGFAGVDLQLGLASFTNTLVPTAGGRDYFSQNLNSTVLAGAYLSLPQDTLYFIKYNTVNNTFNTPVIISSSSTEVDATARHMTTAASNGQNIFTCWSYGGADGEKYLAKESVNGGTSFGSIITVLPFGAVVGGDSVGAWVSMDILYKPGTTTKCAVLQTVPPGTSTSRKGYKILFWSPAVNSGNPTVIADWHASTIPLLNDSNLYNADTSLFQVNMTYVSNPSFAYTDNGSRIICVFQGAQTQYTSYNYHYFDVYSSYSDDNGATWSAPINLTNTPNLDEINPTISKTGNSPNTMHLSFMVSECPGSNSFTNTGTPRCPNYWVYRRWDPVTGTPIGVQTISNEIPAAYSLQQNFPNPFNPTTKIRFALPKNDNVTLKIYDITGREVATVINNEFTSAGLKEVEFNASNIASGVYYYVLKSGNFTDTKKMVLVK